MCVSRLANSPGNSTLPGHSLILARFSLPQLKSCKLNLRGKPIDWLAFCVEQLQKVWWQMGKFARFYLVSISISACAFWTLHSALQTPKNHFKLTKWVKFATLRGNPMERTICIFNYRVFELLEETWRESRNSWLVLGSWLGFSRAEPQAAIWKKQRTLKLMRSTGRRLTTNAREQRTARAVIFAKTLVSAWRKYWQLASNALERRPTSNAPTWAPQPFKWVHLHGRVTQYIRFLSIQL